MDISDEYVPYLEMFPFILWLLFCVWLLIVKLFTTTLFQSAYLCFPVVQRLSLPYMLLCVCPVKIHLHAAVFI